MLFKEPTVEFVALSMEDVVTESSSGSQIDICQGNRPTPEQDSCSSEVM